MKIWEEIEAAFKDADGPLLPQHIHARMVAAGSARSVETVRGELQVHCTEQLNNKKRNQPYIFESLRDGTWRLRRGAPAENQSTLPTPPVAIAVADVTPELGKEPVDNTRFSYLLAVLWTVAETRAADIDGVRALVNRVPEELVRLRGHTVENYAESFNKRIIGVPRDEFFTLVLAALKGDTSGLDAQIRRASSYAEYLRSEDGAESRLASCLDALRGVAPGVEATSLRPEPDEPTAWTRIVDDCQVRVEEWEGKPSFVVNSVGGSARRRGGFARLLTALSGSSFELVQVAYHPQGGPLQPLPLVPTPAEINIDSAGVTRNIFTLTGKIAGANQGSRLRLLVDGASLADARQLLAQLRDWIPLPPPPPGKEIAAIHAALEAGGWVFELWQIAAYVTALRTKPFLILGGVSGTGKSELPGLVSGVTGAAPRTRVAVRPDWTDSSDLLGYRDLQGVFRPGDLAIAARDAADDDTRFHVCLIDEMNLARVEHYFAEVLSAIEERSDDGSGASGRLLGKQLAGDDPGWAGLRIPPNLALVGTVNMDESTFGFSKKVLDRAFTIELSTVDLGTWRKAASAHPLSSFQIPVSFWLRSARRLADLSGVGEPAAQQVDAVIATLVEVNLILAPAQLHLGYRSRDEIVLFVRNASQAKSAFVTRAGEPVDPFDLAMLMKVLPRISGGSRAIRIALAHLLCWAAGKKPAAAFEEAATAVRDDWEQQGRPAALARSPWPRTSARLALMWDRMVEEGFTSYWI
ncbi:MAG: AAA family ATPase [Pseudomonadota bacterium]|nr:AAA family ATPase [Pseudomonadota bacterium]